MRIGQSIWSREDFNLNNPRSSLVLSSKSKTLLKFRSDTDLTRHDDKNDEENEQDFILPHGNIINSSKNLFLNTHLRSRIYEQQQYVSNDGSVKTVYYFRSTRICIDHTGPFWPMAFPIKHPTPSFSFLTRNDRKHHVKELYYLHDNHFLGANHQQTYDNQPALLKYTDIIKHPILIYDMDKSPRQQQPKSNESEQTCPALIFESRFEGGNLRQVKRV